MQKSSLVLLWSVVSALALTACGGGSSDDSTPPPTNLRPSANAGFDQTVVSSTSVMLDGSLSADPDGSVTAYAWTQTAGTAVTLSNSSTARPTFPAPDTDADIELTFSLVVTDNGGSTSTADTVTVTVTPPVPGSITGRVRFMRIPATVNGLDYSAGELQPARGVLVIAVPAGTENPTVAAALDSAMTNPDGSYSLSIEPNTDFEIAVVARMARETATLPTWNFRVVDEEVDAETPYAYSDGVAANSSEPVIHDVDIPSGFDATGNVTGERASAPFAILDTIYQAVQLVLSVAPDTEFPELLVDWATDNPGGGTYFEAVDTLQHIVLSADVNEDTDEFDQHVVAHEFGHYVEFNFSRSDSIGGAHGLGDKLDVRVAFGEGFGYAFGAIVLNDPVSHDTFVDDLCPNSQCSSIFDVDENPATLPADAVPAGNFGCWCSESSVWSILWDIYDAGADANDAVALGFAPLWDVMVNDQRTTPAFTSIFSFISSLKDAYPASASAIDTLVGAQNIDAATIDIYGSNETHVPTPVAAAAALPLYTDITVGGDPVVLRNVNDAGTYNTLGNHRYLKFTLTQTQNLTITVTSSNPNDADPDVYVYRDGEFIALGFEPPPQPETLILTEATPGDYVIDVYDCENGCFDDTGTVTGGDYDITVTVN